MSVRVTCEDGTKVVVEVSFPGEPRVADALEYGNPLLVVDLGKGLRRLIERVERREARPTSWDLGRTVNGRRMAAEVSSTGMTLMLRSGGSTPVANETCSLEDAKRIADDLIAKSTQ